MTILVVILSTALAVFLLLAIIAAVKIVQILNHLKALSEKAEQIADSAESVGDFFKQSVKSVSIVRLLTNIHDAFTKDKKRR